MQRPHEKQLVVSRQERGSALILVLVLLVGLLGLGTLVMEQSNTLSRSQALETQRVQAMVAAEAGAERAAFIASRTDVTDWATTFASPGYAVTDANFTGSSSYSATILSTGAGAIEITSTGTSTGNSSVSRTIRTVLGTSVPEAFQYTLFGNDVHFDNHMKGTYGLSIQANLWSNGDLKVDRGLTMTPTDPSSTKPFLVAVGSVLLDTGPAGSDMAVPTCIIDGTAGDHIVSELAANTTTVDGVAFTNIRDGNNTSPFFAPNFGDAIPEQIPMPYPSYDSLKAKAVSDGTYFATAAALNAFLTTASAQVVIDTTAQAYSVPVANPASPGYAIKLGIDNDGDAEDAANGDWVGDPGDVALISKLTTVGSKSNPLVIYCDETISFDFPSDEHHIFYGSIVSEMDIYIHAPFEVYASYDENGDGDYTDPNDFDSKQPVLVAAGKIKVDDKDHTDGTGGPVHIEGVVYAETEVHIHQTDPFNAVYMKGSQVSVKVHNCEWFSFYYDPVVQQTGFFSEVSLDTTPIQRISWQEIANP